MHMCACARSYTHTQIHTPTYTEGHACVHAHTHTCTHARARTHTHTHTNTHTHTVSHTHTHTDLAIVTQPDFSSYRMHSFYVFAYQNKQTKSQTIKSYVLLQSSICVPMFKRKKAQKAKMTKTKENPRNKNKQTNLSKIHVHKLGSQVTS